MSEYTKKHLKIASIVLLAVVLMIIFINYKGPTGIVAENGFADLSNVSFENMKIMHLANSFVPLPENNNTMLNSYYVSLKLPKNTDNLAVRIPTTECNYLVYINGQRIYNHKYSDPIGFSNVKYYPVTSQNISIVVSYDSSGTKLFDDPLQRLDLILGSVDRIYHYQTLSLIQQISLVIICIIAAFLHLIIFFFNRTNKIHLYLFTFSITVIVELLFINKILIHFFVPVINLNFAIYLLMGTYIMRFISLIFISYDLLGQYIKNTIFPYIYGFLAIVGIILSLKFNSYIDMIFIFDIIIFFLVFSTFLYAVYLYIKYYQYHNSNIDIIVTNYPALIIGYFADILGMALLIEFHSRIQMSQIVFLLIQSSILSKEHFNSIENTKSLSDKLKSAVFEMQNNRSSYIQTHIKPQYLYETLDTIEANIDTDQDKVDNLIQSLAKYLRQSFDFSIDSKNHSLKNELELCSAYIDLVKEQHPEITFVLEDQNVPNAIVPQYSIQALIENSIIHAFGSVLHPTVTVEIDTNQNMVNISVYDNGIGMNRDDIISAIVLPKESLTLGLYHINQLLIDQNNNGLQINSVINKYTKISFSVPISEKSEVNPFA